MSHLTSLETLYLIGVDNRPGSLHRLSKLPNLTTLVLYDWVPDGESGNIGYLKRCPALTHLYLSDKMNEKMRRALKGGKLEVLGYESMEMLDEKDRVSELRKLERVAPARVMIADRALFEPLENE